MSRASLPTTAGNEPEKGRSESSSKPVGVSHSTFSKTTIKSRLPSTVSEIKSVDMKVLQRADPYACETALKRKIENPLAQTAAAIAVSLCSTVIGFAAAYSSPALESMKKDNAINPSVAQASWIGSLLPVGALFGGLSGGFFIETIGRKNTIMSTALPFILCCADHISMIYIGRAIGGFCVGIASLAIPVYLGETLQPEIRGTLGLCPTTFGNFGILLCYMIGKYLNWSHLAFCGSCLPIPYLVFMFFVPETPLWYVCRNKKQKALDALKWLRGKESPNVMKEMSDLQNAGVMNDSPVTLQEFFTNKYLSPLSISFGLMFFQQFSGIDAVIFYTVSIFEETGTAIDSNLSSVIVGVVNLIATFVAAFLIDKLGRRVLLCISEIFMSLTLASIGLFFYLKNSGTDVTHFTWLPLTSFVLFVVGFSLGMGPIPWLMMGEILPAKVRSIASSIATSFNWTCMFIVTKAFISVKEVIGTHSMFWVFTGVCCSSLIFIILCVPETKGRSLEDIERSLRGGKVSSRTYLRPLPSAL